LQLTTTRETRRLIDIVARLGGDQIEVLEAEDKQYVDFVFGDVPCFAYLKDGGTRIRGSVILDDLDVGTEAEAWVSRQPQPESGQLETTDGQEGDRLLRILFERTIEDAVLDADPLHKEAQVYAAHWRDRIDMIPDGVDGAFVVPGDPRDVVPANGWLLLGDGASFPSKQDLLDDTRRSQTGIFDYLWTTSKQTDVGDLMLIYYIAPRKAAHFIARAASRAFFDRDIEVNTEKDVANEQWWCYITPPIEIEPIPYMTLRKLAGGHLPLRGRSGVYLRPDVVATMPIKAKKPVDGPALEQVFRTPVGRADLPRPDAITAELWSSLASGALGLESQVEQYLVEPLLRLTLSQDPRSAWKKSFKIGRTVADYVVLRDSAPHCVIEVKLAVRESPGGVWANSKDFQQVRRYADALSCSSALVDANRIYLIERGADEPHRIVDRRHATAEDLKAFSAHFTAAPRRDPVVSRPTGGGPPERVGS
jgi:hypothetical protein